MRLYKVREIRGVVLSQNTSITARCGLFDLFEIAVTLYAGLPSLSRVRIAIGFVILLLDQKPVLPVLGGIVFHQDERPAALQPLTFEIEFERR